MDDAEHPTPPDAAVPPTDGGVTPPSDAPDPAAPPAPVPPQLTAETQVAAPSHTPEPVGAELDLLALGGLGLALIVGVGGGLLLRRRRPALSAEDAVPELETPADPAHGTPVPAATPPASPAPDRGPSVLERMRGGLARTSAGLSQRLASAFGRDAVDAALYEELEEALLIADVGVKTTTRLLEQLRQDARAGGIEDPVLLRASLERAMLALFEGQDRALAEGPAGGPTVILVVGVNGSGKTTSIGKLAARYTRAGRSVLMGAGDTFRAGAIDQLRIWSERASADFVAHQEGADPAAVIFDALEAAMARGSDVVLCDTAGRLQSTKPLMAELEKVHRIVGRAVPGAPHEVLLVLDATMGQNALSQARIFGEVTGVTGVVLTKLDGTAKGGIVLAIAAELGLPVKFIGVGEQVDDLRPFEPQAFVTALLEHGAGAP